MPDPNKHRAKLTTIKGDYLYSADVELLIDMIDLFEISSQEALRKIRFDDKDSSSRWMEVNRARTIRKKLLKTKRKGKGVE